MTDMELVAALQSISVETGSLVCLGCGREHNCGIHGCAILREAVEGIEQLSAGQSPNPPLTLEELRGMGNEQVWIKDWHVEWFGASRIGIERASEALTLAAWRAPVYYGEWWLAYRRKPEE